MRCFGLLTSINGNLKGYFYTDGYIRTSSKEFSLLNLQNKFVHLTNDAVQKKSEDYGKYENGNKISYSEFQKWVDQNYPELNIDFNRDIQSQIKKLIADSFRAVYTKIDMKKRQQQFEIFGFDFMLDENFQLSLIEVNTNPCLETSCPLLARIMTELIDNSLRIAADPLFVEYFSRDQELSGTSFQEQG